MRGPVPRTTILGMSGADSPRARLADTAWTAVAAVPDPEIGLSPDKEPFYVALAELTPNWLAALSG